MAVGISAAVANAILNSLGRAVSWTPPVAYYCKLHTGDPGAAGAGNAATETTRKLVTFSAASAGSMTTSADLTWTSVAGSETYSHISFWDAVSAGTFLGSGALTASKAVVAGDTFTIAAGSETITAGAVAA